jgi:hypothetical protein
LHPETRQQVEILADAMKMVAGYVSGRTVDDTAG